MNQQDLEGEGKAYLAMHPVLFYGISIGLYAAIVAAACFIEDITLVFGIIGSIAGSYLIFLAPGSFYLVSVKNEGEEISMLRRVVAWIYLLLGVFVLFACLFATIYTAID